MRKARQAWIATLIFASLGSAAQAGELPRPVCARNEVLDAVADDIASRGIDAVIVPGDVGEAPTSAIDTVRCAVRLQSTIYDTAHYGYVPQTRLLLLEFTVRAGRNGLFVNAVGNPR